MIKKNRIGWLITSLAAAVLFLGGLLTLPKLVFGYPSAFSIQHQPDIKIDNALQDALTSTEKEKELRFIVHMASERAIDFNSLPQDEVERRNAVVSQLKETAAISQVSVEKQLNALKQEGSVSSYTSLWIINAIAVQGTPPAVNKMASRPDVQRIYLDKAERYFDHPDLDNYLNQEFSRQESNGSPEWGIRQIQADKVWRELGINGDGITVAVVDTGVDLFHPDLIDNYRGNQGDGTFAHEKNWFHASIPTSTIPFDFHGHGTHVTGSAVGKNGIGVAPGAKWIAAAIADENGIIHDSSIHKAFQWLLAPGGDPAAAPDVINNSWGGAGGRTEFLEDVQILHTAGIITVFAAGNTGPAQGTVLSPASFAGTIAVGASDDQNQPAWFSSRGPSPLTNEIKPLLLAPGTQIVSAKPGGSTVRQSGTSMSAPHAAGTIALMLSAEPTMSRSQVINTLTKTALPLSQPLPNTNSGYGLIDAFSAVLSRMDHGLVTGRLLDGQIELGNIQVSISGDQGLNLTRVSDQNGRFKFFLPPGNYKITINSFGFEELESINFQVLAGTQNHKELTLQKKPSGIVRGIISDEIGPISNARITISSAPISLTTDENGRFQTSLPQGQYSFNFQASGYRSTDREVQVNPNQDLSLNVNLEKGPSILVVDSGQWRYESAAGYYLDALNDNGYSSDVWSISDPNNALPTLEDLLPYEIVIWSSPSDSPVRLAVNETLIRYLNQGGNLIISGQNLASLDGRAGFEESWFLRKLQGEFVSELSLSGSPHSGILGVDGTLFSGLDLSLNGRNSAQNQESPDLVRSRPGTFSEPIFLSEDGTAMGLQSGFCEPFRIVYLGFGLEGVSDVQTRSDLLKRSLDTLQASRNSSGVGWSAERDRELVVPGQQLTIDIDLQNLSELITDTFDLTLNSSMWGSELITKTLTLNPCQIGQTSLIVDVPEDVPLDYIQNVRLTAVSQSNPQTRADVSLELKTPGRILLVDDDRFFDGAPAYTASLDKLQLDYDIWDTEGKNLKPNIPTGDLLNAYEFIIWFTGYDWHAPITGEENWALSEYLHQGGRLFLSSQDFLFYNQYSPLSGALGVVDYQETMTPTVVFGEPSLALPPDLAGPLPLKYGLYQNFSDGIIPTFDSQPFIWHDQGMAAGIGRSQEKSGRSIFWGIPFEAIPGDQQTSAMNSVLGWLTDWGDSTFEVDQRRGGLEETRTFTLTLKNRDLEAEHAIAVTNTIPAGLELLSHSINGNAKFDAGSRQLTWQGTLEAGGVHQISYQARLNEALIPGGKVVNNVQIFDPQQQLSFQKSVPVWFNVPDLSQSQLVSRVSKGPLPEIVTYTISLQNEAPFAADQVTATLRFSDNLFPLEDTLTANQGDIQIDNQRIIWNGSISPRQHVKAGLVLTRSAFLDMWLPATLIIEDGHSDPIILDDLNYTPPYQSFFPIFAVHPK